MKTYRLCVLALAGLLAVASGTALADGAHHHGPAIGSPAKASQATRTVNVALRDIAFEPASIEVKAGETVRFVLKNEGMLLHEFAIGTAAMHAAHQKEMMVMLEHGMITPTGIDAEKMKMDHSSMGMGPMKHDDPNSVLLEPGKSAELVWTFPKAMTLEFACNVPGHYPAGMVGEFKFSK